MGLSVRRDPAERERLLQAYLPPEAVALPENFLVIHPALLLHKAFDRLLRNLLQIQLPPKLRVVTPAPGINLIFPLLRDSLLKLQKRLPELFALLHLPPLDTGEICDEAVDHSVLRVHIETDLLHIPEALVQEHRADLNDLHGAKVAPALIFPGDLAHLKIQDQIIQGVSSFLSDHAAHFSAGRS